MSSRELIVYTDGACFPNPGGGGWGAVIIEPAGGGSRVERRCGKRDDQQQNGDDGYPHGAAGDSRSERPGLGPQ